MQMTFETFKKKYVARTMRELSLTEYEREYIENDAKRAWSILFPAKRSNLS